MFLGAMGGERCSRGKSAGMWEEPAFIAVGECGGVRGLERDLQERSVAVGRWEGVWVNKEL